MSLTQLADRLRKRALTYPETYEESPWGDRVVKVRGKIFFFCGVHEGKLMMSMKLPQSGRQVLKNSWARPTPYGLGKSGWVSCSFAKAPAEKQVAAWIDESYRALAPKKLVAQIAAAPAAKKAAPVARIRARVLLLCEDALRADRATKALADRGITLEVVDSDGAVRARLRKKTVDAVILDVGRRQDIGLRLAGEIDSSDDPVHIFIVGIRDATARRKAAELATSADLFKQPPGDSQVADAIARTLA